MVGLYYTDNLVIPRDDEKSLYWMRKSVEAGFEPAKKTLESLERNASMRATDTSHTAVPLQIAVAADTAGVGGSTAQLGQLMKETDPEKRRVLGLAGVDHLTVQHDSVEWDALVRAADAGSPEALTLLGRTYQDGWRGSADRIKAAGLYLRAVRMDAPRALSMLWEVLQQEGFVAELKKRAHDDDVEAHFVWAGLLSVGAGAMLLQQQAYVTEDQALRMLRKGAAQSHVPSINELGLCYFAGRWVGADPVRARDEWRKAKSLGSFEAEIRLAMMDVQSSVGNASERPDSQLIASAVQLLEEGVRRGHFSLRSAWVLFRIRGRGYQEPIACIGVLPLGGKPRESRRLSGPPSHARPYPPSRSGIRNRGRVITACRERHAQRSSAHRRHRACARRQARRAP